MSNSKISIRRANISDLTELQTLFVNTIKTICKEDYSIGQINAWASAIENHERWINKLTTQYFLIAELYGKIIGFASLENNNYLDFLYVHKDHQRQGIADLLYTEIEKEAIKRKGTIISSDVSKTARPFFEKKGFVNIETQTKKIHGIDIVNFKMTKTCQKPFTVV